MLMSHSVPAPLCASRHRECLSRHRLEIILSLLGLICASLGRSRQQEVRRPVDTQESALKTLIRERHLTYESFCREWDRVARGVDDHLVSRWPGRAQYYRWLRGELVNGHPYPDACRMLEAMFPGWSVESLFSPYTGSTPEPPSEPDTVSAGETHQITSEISVSEVTGMPSHTIDLSGEWWASWQTFRDGAEKIATQQVECEQSGDLIKVATTTHGLSTEEGGYHWTGELRLWDNEILMGWYAAHEGSVRAKGTMYFAIHPHGLHMAGRWVGLGYDDRIMTGWGSMAKTREAAEAVIERLNKDHEGINV